MIPRMDDYKAISARIKKSSIEELEKIAEAEESTLTHLLRRIIADFLKTRKKQNGHS